MTIAERLGNLLLRPAHLVAAADLDVDAVDVGDIEQTTHGRLERNEDQVVLVGALSIGASPRGHADNLERHTADVESLPDRVHFIQYRQDTVPPKKWENAVITSRWRLVYGTELYDIKADPGQQYDVAAQYLNVAADLCAAHEAWWAEIAPRLDAYCPISLGNDAENPTRLDAMDVLGDVAWHQGHILMAQQSTGIWAVDVEQPGKYTFALRRWPEELDLPIDALAPDEEAARIPYPHTGQGVVIQPLSARLKLFDREATVAIQPGAKEVTFTLDLPQTGVTQLEAWFIAADGAEQGAYYVTVERA